MPLIPHTDRLCIRLNALLRAYVRNETIVQGQPMTCEEIVAEIQAIHAQIEQANNPAPPEESLI